MKTNIKAGLLAITLLCGSQNLWANENTRGHINIINKGNLSAKNSPNRINKVKNKLAKLRAKIKNLSRDIGILRKQQIYLSEAIIAYEKYAKDFENMVDDCVKLEFDNTVLLKEAPDISKERARQDIEECIEDTNFALEIDDSIKALSEKVLEQMKLTLAEITRMNNKTKQVKGIISYLNSSISYLERVAKVAK